MDLIVFTIGPLINQIYWSMVVGCVLHFVVWLAELLSFLSHISSDKNTRKIEQFIKTQDVQDIALFGTGLAAEHFTNWLQTTGLETSVGFYLDNNPEKHGTDFNNKPVLPPNRLAQEKPDLVVITSKGGYHEIAEQLGELGMEENQDFIYANFS